MNAQYFGESKVTFRGFRDFCEANRTLVMIVSVMLLLAYGSKLLLYSIGIDTELYVADKREFLKWNLQIGRWGLTLLQTFWYIDEFNPVVSYATALCVVWLSTLSWCYVVAVFTRHSGKNSNLIPFALLLMLSSVWVEQLYFVYQAAETTAMILLCPFAVYFLYRGFLDKKKHDLGIAFTLLVVMTSVYQAMAFLVAACILAFFILVQDRSSYEPKFYWRLILSLFAMLAGAIIVSTLVGKVLLHLSGTAPSPYLGGMTRWGVWSIGDNVREIFRFVHAITWGRRSPELGIIGNPALLPAFAFFVARLLASVRKNHLEKRRILYALTGIGVPLCILVLPIILGGGVPVRALYALPFAIAFMAFFVLSSIKSNVARLTIFVLTFIASAHQAQLMGQLLYSDFLRYEADVRLATELDRSISSLVDETQGGDVRVALVGTRKVAPILDPNFLPGEVIGHSFFEWDPNGFFEATRRGLAFMQTLGMRYEAPTVTDMERAREAAEAMPVFPGEGSVRRVSDLIVVKLSDSRYIP